VVDQATIAYDCRDIDSSLCRDVSDITQDVGTVPFAISSPWFILGGGSVILIIIVGMLNFMKKNQSPNSPVAPLTLFIAAAFMTGLLVSVAPSTVVASEELLRCREG
jgi:FtsH-binding integral membrane protein